MSRTGPRQPPTPVYELSPMYPAWSDALSSYKSLKTIKNGGPTHSILVVKLLE